MEIKLPFTVQKEIAEENLDGSDSSAWIRRTWGMGALWQACSGIIQENLC